MSDLEAIINGDQAVEEAPVEEPKVEEAVVVEETPAEAATTEEPAKELQMVPLAALQEVRRELQDMKSRLPQPEAPKAPDVIEDPEGYQSYSEQRVQQAVYDTKLELSRFSAEREFGSDLIQQVEQFFADRPEQTQAFRNHASPFHAAVSEYQKHQVAEEIGKDPAAYAAKVREEALREAKAQLVAEQAQKTAATAAPSMANITGTGGGAKTTWAGPTSLEQLF